MTTFNLNKTEFTAYLDCSLKFYLLKQQNQRCDHGSRGKRDYHYYSPGLGNGIQTHRKLNDFLQDFKKNIQANDPPAIIYSDPILRHFWKHECHRLAVNPDHWFPLAVELYLHTSTMRGIIDRVDPLDARSCCLVEYKSSRERSGFLHEELLFYALLASRSKVFAQKIGRKVVQVAGYFYETGDYLTREVTPELLVDFATFLQGVREDISRGTWSPKVNCSLLTADCQHAVLCTLVPEKLKTRG
ncbi:MAG: PD-(D/E)XK nuclease family protein [Candidatus Heimdallarchaeota archaeon]|nr:PD-(D/E)XK nuclease family protein [Candidatus Heimdallarchaeota archaeon]